MLGPRGLQEGPGHGPAREHPSVRCDHLQPGRSLALMGAYSGLLDRSLARIAKQGTVGADRRRLRAEAGPIGRMSGRDGR